jgi:hypothetical protein
MPVSTAVSAVSATERYVQKALRKNLAWQHRMKKSSNRWKNRSHDSGNARTKRRRSALRFTSGETMTAPARR